MSAISTSTVSVDLENVRHSTSDFSLSLALSTGLDANQQLMYSGFGAIGMVNVVQTCPLAASYSWCTHLTRQCSLAQVSIGFVIYAWCFEADDESDSEDSTAKSTKLQKKEK
jgi:hypothetical protein